LPAVAADTRFATFEARRQHREALVDILSGRFREKTTADWMERLRGRVPSAPVRSLTEALDRDELQARGLLASYTHRTFGTVHEIGAPFTLGGFEPEYSAAPAL